MAYKLALVMVAAIAGMIFDFLAFPYALPSSYLDRDWRKDPDATGDDGKPTFPLPPAIFARSARLCCVVPSSSRLLCWPWRWGCSHAGRNIKY